MFDVITIGSATRDVFLKNVGFDILKNKKSSTDYFACLSLGSKIELEDIIFETGGGATNTAAAFSGLKLKTAIVSRVGNDLGGKEIISALKNGKIYTNFIIRDKKNKTAYSLILLTSSGERTILVHRGASRHFSEKDIPWKKLKTKWLYISSLGGNVYLLSKLLNFARRKKIKTAINPGALELKEGLKKLKPILNKADILFLNREEASGLTNTPLHNLRQIINAAKQNFQILTVITDGGRGAYMIEDDRAIHAPTFKVKIVNTTGAGDAFGAGFTAGMILKNDSGYALRLGILNSNSVVQKMGAKAGILKKIPSLKKLNTVKIKKI